MRRCEYDSYTRFHWFTFLCDICAQCLIDYPCQLGVGKEVQIDESKQMHRKFRSGTYRDDHWILRMVEHGSNHCVLIEVPDRSPET